MRPNLTLNKLHLVSLFIGVAALLGNANTALAESLNGVRFERSFVMPNALALQVPTITWNTTLSARPYGSANFTPATSNSTAAITFTSDNPAVAIIENNRVQIVGVGTAVITASQVANTRYEAIQVSATLNVVQASPVITFNNLNLVYSTENFIAATATLGAPINFTSSNPDVATIDNSQIKMVGAGTATITATIEGSEKYTATQATALLTVTKAAPTITFVNNFSPRSYTITDFVAARTNLGATIIITSDNPLVATIENNQVNMVGPGKANITATIVDDSRYVGIQETRELVVIKAAPVITFVNLTSRPYSTVDFVAATATLGAPIIFTSDNPAVAIIVDNRVNMVGVGTANITATITATDQYEGTESIGTLTVVKALPIIRFANDFSPRTFTTADFTPGIATAGATVTFTSSNPAVATIVNNMANMVTTGTTIITATVADDDLYIGTTLTRSLTITQAHPSISFANMDPRPYTTTDFTPATTNFGARLIFTSDNPAVATIVSNRVNMVGLGTANITATIPNSANYAGTTSTAVLKVVRATPVIKFVNDFSPKVYSANPFTAATNSIGVPMVVTSDNPAVATIVNNRVNTVSFGTANITATIADHVLYAGTTATQELTVTQKAQTITFADLPAKTYFDAPFDLAATASSDLPVTFTSSDETVVTVTGTKVTIIGVGTATITASQAGNNSFAAAPDVARTLVINKMPQTIDFAALPAKTYGDAPFTLTSTATSNLPVTYSSSNPQVATILNNIVTIIGAGETTITAAQPGNDHYEPAPDVTRVFTVNKLNQTISFNALPVQTFGNVPFALSASATSGLPVTFITSNPAVATVNNGNIVTITGGGTAIITALQPGNQNYNAAISIPQTLIVNKASQAITFNTLSNKVYTDVPFALTATATSTQPVTYTSSNEAVATVSGNIVTITGVGVTTITASQPGNTNYTTAANALQTLTVDKAIQAITFNSLPNKAYGDAPFTLNATTSSNLSVTYTSSNESVATVAGNTVTIVGAGTTTITATQTGSANYLEATNISQLLTVGKAGQTITFAALPNKTYGDASFDLIATSSSNLPVTFTSSNLLIATVSGNTVIITGQGVATITASQTGDANYSTAPTVNQTLTIGKASQTITFSSLPAKLLGDAPFGLNATASSGLNILYTSSNPAVATISGSTVTIVGVGSTVITALQAGNNNYEAAPAITQTLTVITPKGNQSITFTPPPVMAFGGAPFELPALSSAGLTITYTSSNPLVATVSGNMLTITGIGSTVITASQSGNNAFNAAVSVSQTLTVGKANQTLTFAALPVKSYGDASFTLNATSSSTLPVIYTSSNPLVATVNDNTVTITGAGSAVITASQPGNAIFNAAVATTQTLTVNKANQTISFAALPNKTFGDAGFELTATSTSNLPVTFTSSNPLVASVSGSTVTIVSPGVVTITAQQAGNVNYNATTASQTLTVNKASQTITFTNLPAKVLGDAPFGLTATASSGLNVLYTSSNPAVATISGSTVTIVGVGSTVIIAIQSGNNIFEAAPNATQTFTVLAPKSNQTITFAALPVKIIGDAPFGLTATASSGLGVTYASSNPSVATVIGSTVTIMGIGSTTITASQPGNAAYNAAPNATQTLTVTAPKSNQTITFNTLPAKVLGDVPFGLAATASSGLGVNYISSNPLVATVTGNTVTIIGVGSTVITASQAGNATFNAAPDITQTLTVIAPKSNQTIAFAALPAKVFGDAPFGLTATASSGLSVTYTSSNPLVATVSGSTVTIIGVGSTTITASQSGDAAYNSAVSVGQTLTVGKANQTLTFAALSAKTYGDATFALTATATSTLPVTYTSSNLLVATVNNNTVTVIGAGTAVITAVQTGNASYNAAVPVTQLLVVGKAQQTITFNSIPTIVRGNSFSLNTVTSSSGLPVTFTVANTLIASVQGQSLSGNVIGSTTITATQQGNDNYLAATPVTQNVTVSTINGEVDIQVRQAVSPNGDGINDLLFIEGIAKYPNNMVTVINRSGVRVYESKGYDNANNTFAGRSSVNGQLQPPGTYFYLIQYTNNGVGKRLTGYFVLKYQ